MDMRLFLVPMWICLNGWLLSAASSQAAAPAMRVVTGSPGTPLLANGSFENVTAGQPRNWSASPKGYELAEGEGRDRSHALRCDNPSGAGWFGASQTLDLNRTNTGPFRVRGWSKAENVNGSAGR